ncbi:tetratricopeptide repeat protein [Nannocystaceae bacterium ST9]
MTRLGRHLLLDEIGRGGMGVVHAAYDPKLDRKVAIKLMRTRGGPSQRRMIREAQAMARISHPNVVQVYEIDEHEDQTYLVMEFVDGVTLKTWLGQQARTQREILTKFVAAGRGLAAAHAKGLVHRDFKPDNVMIRRDGQVLVMDFGLARGHEARLETTLEQVRELGPTLEQTQASAIKGTPAYMAPEQFRGEPTDARTDQFSFCVALWEALHDQRPFRAANLAALAEAVNEGRIDPPERDVVPAWLRRVVERGLSVDPDQRWPSMDVLLDALGRDPSRRRRALALAAGVIAVSGLTLVGGAAWRAHQRSAALDECERLGRAIEADWNPAVAAALEQEFMATAVPYAASTWSHTRPWLDDYAHAWSELRTQTCVEAELEHTRELDSHDSIVACLDEQRTTFAGLLAAWAELEPATLVAATQAAANLTPLAGCRDEAMLERIRAPEPIRAEVASLRTRLDRIEALDLAGRYAQSLELALALQAEVDALGWRPLQAETLLELGELQANLGHYEDARRSHEQAFFHALAVGDDPTMLNAAAQLTHVVGYYLVDYEQGRLWGSIGEMLIVRLARSGSLREAALVGSIGGLATRRGEHAEALRRFERALEIKESVLGPDHPGVAGTLNSIGVVLYNQAKVGEALVYFRRSLAIEEAAFGPDHPRLGHSLNNLAVVLGVEGRREEALVHHRRALAIREAAFGPDHPDVATSLGNIGLLLAERGELDQALEYEQRALAIFEASLGPEHLDVAITLIDVASVREDRGEYAAALVDLRRALAIREGSLGPEHADVLELREKITELEAEAAKAVEPVAPAPSE